MFRLIKLAAYALLGYALYEFVLGFTGDAQSAKGNVNRSRENEGGEGGRFMTGASHEGTSVHTESADGGRASQVVGRGVVH